MDATAGETIGRRFARLRAARGLSAAEVAAEVGVSESTYREWEQGRRIVGEPYTRLAKVFGVSLRELMTGERETAAPVITRIETIEGLLKEIRGFL